MSLQEVIASVSAQAELSTTFDGEGSDASMPTMAHDCGFAAPHAGERAAADCALPNVECTHMSALRTTISSVDAGRDSRLQQHSNHVP